MDQISKDHHRQIEPYECVSALVPFDLRNLSWRDLFDDADISEATKNGENGWVIELRRDEQVSGFPFKICVDLVGFPPREGSIELEIVNWFPSLATVKGELVTTDRVKLGSSPKKVLEEWRNLNSFDRLKLERVVSRVRDDGNVLCITNYGFAVLCEAESLSMQWLPSGERIRLNSQREAMVVSNRWDNTGEHPEIDPTELPKEVQVQGKGQAIFIRVPRRGPNAGTLCQLFWLSEDNSQSQKTELHVLNFPELRGVQPGTILEAHHEDNAWHYKLSKQFVRTRALWQRVNLEDEAAYGKALGVAFHENARSLVIEVEDGKFALLGEPNRAINHLADVEPPDREVGGIASEWRGNDVERNNPVTWIEGRNRYRRCLLRGARRDNYVLPAICRADDPMRSIYIARVRIELRSVLDGDYTIRRIFYLETDRSLQRSANRNRDDERKQKWLSELAHAIAENMEITGVVRGNYFEQRIPVPDGSGWTQRIPIAPNEGAFVRAADYPKSGTAVLFRSFDQKLLASMRRVTPFNIEQFREEHEAVYNEVVWLVHRLYYVGREIEDEVYFHRFEWGHGLTLRVEERYIQFNDRPFSAAEPVIYHGDAVESVRFLRSEATDSEDGSESSILAIDGVSIRAAQSTTIFKQRTDFNMVHLLQLSMQGDELIVARVAGFDQGRESEKRWFDRVNASMDEDSEDYLKKRFKSTEEDVDEKFELKNRRLFVLGRLDENTYLESLGKSAEFEHVRFSFASSDEGEALRSGEIVFLQMGLIKPKKNDIHLQLKIPDRLSQDDKGDDLNYLIVTRRSFSPRANLLQRILESDGNDALEGKYILIRLEYEADGQHRVQLLHHRLPRRTTDALGSAINAQESPLFCCVLGADDAELDIELRPGILTRLPFSEIESAPRGLGKGAIIRIDANADGPKRFRVTRAGFSETRYLDKRPRDVTVLPMNPLLRDDAPTNPQVASSKYWSSQPKFTIAGLPELTAKINTYDAHRQHLSGVNVKQVISLMEREHPKVATAVLDDRGQTWVLTLPRPNAGKIEYDQDTLKVYKLPLVNGPKSDLRWSDLTFADESASFVARRLRRRWKYHDSMTGYWVGDQVAKTKVLTSTGLTGPLFFAGSENRPILRYNEECIRRFSFPVEELVRYLNTARNMSEKFVVASVSDDGGLFLEIAPGRIVEVPAQRIVWKSSRTERSLRVSWNLFASGDLVELELIRGDVFAVDRLALRTWHAGPRRAFGNRGVWLPVHKLNTEYGSMTLGSGEFQLEVPADKDEMSERSHVFLADTNEISDPHSTRLKVGHVGLLSLDSNGVARIIGFEQYKAQAIYWSDERWVDDPLAPYIIKREGARIFTNWKSLARLINVAGGCLPVTIEQISEKNGSIFFSRSLQKSHSKLLPGHHVLCRVLGAIAPGRTLALSGSGLIILPITSVISGLPKKDEKLERAVLDEMCKNKIAVWCRVDETDGILNGLSNENSDEIRVSIELVMENPASGIPGNTHDESLHWQSRNQQDLLKDHSLLARSVESAALYYMPSKYSSWADLDVNEAKTCFFSDGSTVLSARLEKSDKLTTSVSIVAASEAKKELESLSVGSQISVRTIHRADDVEPGVARYIVASEISGVFLECLCRSPGNLRRNTDLVVEVDRRNFAYGGLVTVVPLGQRSYKLDLPQTLIDSLGTGCAVHGSFANYLNIRRRTAEGDLSNGLDSVDDPEFAICAAYAIVESGDLANLADHLPTVRRWAKNQLRVADFDLPYALMAIILLFEVSELPSGKLTKLLGRVPPSEFRDYQRDWSKMACKLARSVFVRAVRNLHVEVLGMLWLGDEDSRKRRHPPIWMRLNGLCNEFQQPLSRENVGTVTGFTLAADQSGNSEIGPISEGLKASVGLAADTSRLTNACQILGELINIGRTLPEAWSGVEPGLRRLHVERLRLVLNKFDARGYDLQLLPELSIDRKLPVVESI